MIYSCNNVVCGEHVDRAGQELGVSLEHQIATNRILSKISNFENKTTRRSRPERTNL